MIREPMKIVISRSDIVSRTIVFPSGKKISLDRRNHYLTNDPDEIAFASRLKGLGIFKLEDKEFRGWVTNLNVDVSVENEDLTPQQADEFAFTAVEEYRVAEELKRRGWRAYPVGSKKLEIDALIEKLEKDKAKLASVEQPDEEPPASVEQPDEEDVFADVPLTESNDEPSPDDEAESE